MIENPPEVVDIDAVLAVQRRAATALLLLTGTYLGSVGPVETGTYQPRPGRVPFIARAYETSEAEVRGWWTSWDR